MAKDSDREWSGQPLRGFLPEHESRSYAPAEQCVYCGASGNLSDEHIIPYGLGGRMVLPVASCERCRERSGRYEGVCLRTMLGPLRMLYDLPSRRKRERPKTLPLKVKFTSDDLAWTEVAVPQERVPFLILLPLFETPGLLSGREPTGDGRPGARNFWIRGASATENFRDHMNTLISELGVHAIQPVAEARVEDFCLMLAKIAHSFAVAELGLGRFKPFLLHALLKGDLRDWRDLIGGLSSQSPPSNELHELTLRSFGRARGHRLIAVRIRLLARLGTPAYCVIVGHELPAAG